MNPLWWILIGIGGILGLIFLLLTAALFTKTAISVTYNEDGVKLSIRVIGIPITLYPRNKRPKKDKPKPKKPKKAKAKKGNRKKEEPEKESLTDSFKHSLKEARFSDYIEILRIILTEFVGKFGFEKLILHIAVGGEDATKIALNYGRINGLLYPILGKLSAAGKLERCDIQITPDFTSETLRAEGHATFSVRLFHGILCATKLIQKL